MTDDAFQHCLRAWGVTPSMSRKGNPYDNALAESFVATLKTNASPTRPSAGRITNGPTRSSERTRQAGKHVNLYGAYSFLDIGDGVDLQELVNLLEAARGRGAAAPD